MEEATAANLTRDLTMPQSLHILKKETPSTDIHTDLRKLGMSIPLAYDHLTRWHKQKGVVDLTELQTSRVLRAFSCEQRSA